MRKEKSWTRKQYEHCYRTMRRENVANANPLLIGIHAEVINAADYSYQAKDYEVHGWVNTYRMNKFVYKLTNEFYQRGELPF